jgi:hypothetical protein
MSLEIEAALISAFVALITTAIGGFLTWYQIQRERRKWLIDLTTSYALELYKKRLENYPKMHLILANLSKHAPEPLTPEKAKQISQEITGWLYSEGGLCAEASTRGALKGLRHVCETWEHGERPKLISEWRDATLLLLRRDLNLQGIESFDQKGYASLLKMLQDDMSTFK